MIPRRVFVRSSAAFLAAASLTNSLLAQNAPPPVGLQLFTVRSLVGHDLAELLLKVHSIGYSEVETFSDMYTHPAGELRRMIGDSGLRAPSGHFNYDTVESKFDYAKELGVKYLVCPMLPDDLRNSRDGYKRVADQFNRWGERAHKIGLQFAFHNHNYEFKKYGDATGFDILMRGADPNLVALELDCYWVVQAGVDPVDMLHKYANRIRMIHLKDRQKGFPTSQELNDAAEHFAEVGNGTIDWKQILAVAEQQHVRHMFVEQDQTAGDPLQSAAISCRNLEKVLQ